MIIIRSETRNHPIRFQPKNGDLRRNMANDQDRHVVKMMREKNDLQYVKFERRH